MAKTDDVIVDTSFLVAMWLESEPRHDEAWACYEGGPESRFVTTPVDRRTTRIATFDHRRFGSLKPLTGEPAFTLLP